MVSAIPHSTSQHGGSSAEATASAAKSVPSRKAVWEKIGPGLIYGNILVASIVSAAAADRFSKGQIVHWDEFWFDIAVHGITAIGIAAIEHGKIVGKAAHVALGALGLLNLGRQVDITGRLMTETTTVPPFLQISDTIFHCTNLASLGAYWVFGSSRKSF